MAAATTDLEHALERGLSPRSGPPAAHADAVAAAAELYRRARVADDQLSPPYRAGGEWAVYVEQRAHIYDAVLAGDDEVASEKLASFWRNELGPIVSQYAYFPDLEAGDPAKVERFTAKLSRDYVAWRALWNEDPEILAIPEVGEPWGLELDGVLVTPLALRFHSHARKIVELLRDTERPLVAEIGGGYGGMAHRIHQLGEGVTYVDFDLPETLMIAAYHLRLALPDKDVHLWDPSTPLDRDALLEHDVVLVPHYGLEQLPADSVDLFLNAFSLSEMRAETVQEYIGRIAAASRRYFLQNNVDRRGVVNRGFERIPCSEFPLGRDAFKTVAWSFDTFQGPDGDYRESLHERIAPSS
jgi:hypothetical protein